MTRAGVKSRARSIHSDAINVKDLVSSLVYQDDTEAGEEAIDHLESIIVSSARLIGILRQQLYGEEDRELYLEDILKLAGIKGE